MILLCRCGLKLNTPGAVPGRVGKCPRCGSLLKIDEAPAPRAEPRPEPIAAGGPYRRPREARSPLSSRTVWADGLVVIPSAPETTLLGSWNYPLRNASGLGMLAMIPPLLWFGSVPLFALVPMIASASAVTLLGLVLLLPELVILGVVLGHTLLFLGDVVVTSCLGAVTLPRQATWSLSKIVRGWGRWLWAGLFGGVVGGMPALIYWIDCGDVDWFDRVVLIDLILPGLAYAQMAVVIALISESPWAVAHPILILRAIGAGGWSYLGPCLVTGVFLSVVVGLFEACLAIGQPIVQVVAFWHWWVLVLYLAMVGLRFLGLFCFRKRVLTGGKKRRDRGTC